MITPPVDLALSAPFRREKAHEALAARWACSSRSALSVAVRFADLVDAGERETSRRGDRTQRVALGASLADRVVAGLRRENRLTGGPRNAGELSGHSGPQSHPEGLVAARDDEEAIGLLPPAGALERLGAAVEPVDDGEAIGDVRAAHVVLLCGGDEVHVLSKANYTHRVKGTTQTYTNGWPLGDSNQRKPENPAYGGFLA